MAHSHTNKCPIPDDLCAAYKEQQNPYARRTRDHQLATTGRSMTCLLCELPASSLGLCKKHYRADLRARHRLKSPTKDPIRPRRDNVYYYDLLAFIKKELGL